MTYNPTTGYGHNVTSGPWWHGFNDARFGKEYNNVYAGILVTSAYEYQQGYAAALPRPSVQCPTCGATFAPPTASGNVPGHGTGWTACLGSYQPPVKSDS